MDLAASGTTGRGDTLLLSHCQAVARLTVPPRAAPAADRLADELGQELARRLVRALVGEHRSRRAPVHLPRAFVA